jgi:hypothetical protein
VPIFEITNDEIRKIPETSFSAVGIKERGDLQRLLRKQIDVVSPDTLVIAEEFGEWEDSKRRIDLLGIDRDANIVVIELKRTEDGGHMELQAIRYAAMVSTLTFEKAVSILDGYLKRTGSESDARTTILEFLGWESPDEEDFAQDVRIVLASAEFSKELTTAVIWLNDHGLDIRCVRMQPYEDHGRVLVDVQQVIPLPEAAAYQVQVREKEQRSRQGRAERYGIRKRFWQSLLMRARDITPLHSNISPGEHNWIGAGSGVRGLSFNYVIRQNEGTVELYIDRGAEKPEENKRIFDWFLGRKQQIEEAFGGELSWQRLDEKRSCRIACTLTGGGWRSEESKWPQVQDAMINAMDRLEKALKPQLSAWKADPSFNEQDAETSTQYTVTPFRAGEGDEISNEAM